MEHISVLLNEAIDYLNIKEDGILIDDDIKNLKQWAKAGQEIYFVETKGQKVVF